MPILQKGKNTDCLFLGTYKKKLVNPLAGKLIHLFRFFFAVKLVIVFILNIYIYFLLLFIEKKISFVKLIYLIQVQIDN